MLSGLVHDRIICLLGACTSPPHLAIVEELAGKSLHAELHRNADGSQRCEATPMPYAKVRRPCSELDAQDMSQYSNGAQSHRVR